MRTPTFWLDALERAAKSAAQAPLVLWAVGDGLLDVVTVDWPLAGGVAAGGFALSLLTSIASARVGDDESPSLVDR